MTTYSLSHLSDQTLVRELAALVARDRITTAALLAHIAEVDGRKLYLPAGYPSMYCYCTQELRLSEEAARKRIHAARTARRIPAVFDAIADGRLHLSAVILLAPYLSHENAQELLAAATHKTKFEIEQLIVERFPRLDVPAMVQALDEPPIQSAWSTDERAPGRVEHLAPGIEALDLRPKVTPLAPQRFALQLTMSQELHDKLRYAQDLLSHCIPSGDVAQVLERALDALIPQLEKRKFAANSTRRHGREPSTRSNRHVPAHVRRSVWKRDGGQCTFVSETGHRCRERRFLQFDHIDPVARGGLARVERMRLRCRAHNQYAAERTFGVEFMRHKRQEARAAQAARQAQEARETARTAAVEKTKAQDVIPWLRALGFRADEARQAAEVCETIPDASLEQRVRLALTYFRPRTPSRGRAACDVAGH